MAKRSETEVTVKMPGKLSFDQCYKRSDPACFFAEFGRYGYCSPVVAAPAIESLGRYWRRRQRATTVTIVDVGCSYGINAMLLRTSLGWNTLGTWYRSKLYGELDPARRVMLDKVLFELTWRNKWLRVVGVDISRPALLYAQRTGLIDRAVCQDFETSVSSKSFSRKWVTGAGFLVATGSVGYVTEKTIGSILDQTQAVPMLIALFVSRTYDAKPMVSMLKEQGFAVCHMTDCWLRQRRFGSTAEQRAAIRLVKRACPWSRLMEKDGWVYAHPLIACKDPRVLDSIARRYFGGFGRFCLQPAP